ncbi:hypothetical protein V8D89_002818 [Ganoderma adspersum]
MQLPANGFKAIQADTDPTSHRPDPASASSSSCREHAEELRARARTAMRDADRLKPIIDQMLSEGVEVYTQVREAQKNELFVRLYLESLEQQIGAAVALRSRFFSEAADRCSGNLAVLVERKGSVVAFLAALRARAGDIERELTREREQEQAAAPSEDPEPEPAPATATPAAPVPTPAPAAAPDPDEPPAYPILDVPHPPCACTAGTRDNRPHTAGGPPSRCTALRLRDRERCTWTCAAGQRFCRIWHCVGHGTVVMSHQAKEEMLELLRKTVGRGEGDDARRVRDVKNYVEMLEEMITIVEDHQRLFSCRSPDTHAALLRDLTQRRTSAGLLLGRLSGRTDVAVAENQGQAETWATEFLAEVKNKDAIERRKTVEDLLTGAIVGGASAWFGVPWARSAVAGVVSSLVARKARDSAEKS